MLTKKDLEIYNRAFNGKCSLIGWGFRLTFYTQRWQEVFPLKKVTEANHQTWDMVHSGYTIINPLELRDFDPKKHAVIDYYHIKWVEDYVKRISGMPLINPAPLQHILRGIKTGGKAIKSNVRPLGPKQIEEIKACAMPFINDTDQDKLLPALKLSKKQKEVLGGYDWPALVAGLCAGIEPYKTSEKNIILAGNSLCFGGAERQLVNLALGFQEQGWTVRSLSVTREPHASHYLNMLQSAGIAVQRIMDGTPSMANAAYARQLLDSMPENIRLALWHLPVDFTISVAQAYQYFKTVKPQTVIAYLDWGSIIAGLAALLAGVPKIVLSGRNYGPQHFPHFFRGTAPDFRLIYRAMATCPRVHLTNNSRLGGKDYADWMGLAESDITYIPNCLAHEFFAPPKTKVLQGLRRTLNIKPTDKVIVGVFRLAPEKRPEQFVETVAEIAKSIPNVRAFICGDGSSRAVVENMISKLGVQKHVTLLGECQDVKEMMNIADILLHTSQYEGMPNVMLEAQSQGLPIVATKSGGVDDCLAKELRPYSYETNDWKGVVKGAVKLLRDDRLRKKLGTAAKAHAHKEFTVEKLVKRNLAVANSKKTGKD